LFNHLFSVVFQSLVGFCFFWPRVCLLLFVYSIEVINTCLDYCLVLLFGWLSIAPHCLPLIPSNPPSPSAGPLAMRHSNVHIGSGSAETPTAQPALRHSYTTLGSAVGTPLGRAHRVVLPSPPNPPPMGRPWLGRPSVRRGLPPIRWGVWERGGGFEGLQGETQGIGV
jgi:hypothetical protein